MKIVQNHWGNDLPTIPNDHCDELSSSSYFCSFLHGLHNTKGVCLREQASLSRPCLCYVCSMLVRSGNRLSCRICALLVFQVLYCRVRNPLESLWISSMFQLISLISEWLIPCSHDLLHHFRYVTRSFVLIHKYFRISCITREFVFYLKTCRIKPSGSHSLVPLRSPT